MKEHMLGTTSSLARGILLALGLSSVIPVSAGTSISEIKSQFGAELQVLGQVQQIDSTRGVIIVAGQHISISRQTAFLVSDVQVANTANQLQSIKPGDLLAVSGPVGAPAVSIDRLDSAYVAGSTSIYVKGKISAVDSEVGVAKIGELGVDFTPAMYDPELSTLAVGQIVEAVGIQTSSTAKLLAEHLSISGTSSVSPGSISGTSVVKADSISGTSVVKPSSISGTSVVKADSISGTSVVKADSISGTSVVKPSSISGTSVVKADSISGTSVVKPSSISGT
ncbi:MAG: hypothetical protein ABSD02_20815, partial [Steroidobacteraceae bacterium]